MGRLLGIAAQLRRDDRSRQSLDNPVFRLYSLDSCYSWSTFVRVSAIRTRSQVNPLVDMLNAQSARKSLYSLCADLQILLTQNLQSADFFAATSYAAKRKKQWAIFPGVH